jgi:Ca2+-transporting ATPase
VIPPRDAPAIASAYRETVESVATRFGTDLRRGLTEDEARSRLARSGPNELAAKTPVPAWRRLRRSLDLRA